MVCSVFVSTGHTQTTTQTITLQPGWNSVYLEVQPSNNAANVVFGGLPLASVWTRAERLSAVDYIQNASEVAFNDAGWLGWFHPSRPEAFLNNLHSIEEPIASLSQIQQHTPVVWTLTVVLRCGRWNGGAGCPNLRGLPVGPAAPPTFLDFFRYSKAHFNSINGLLEKIYRLNASGQWTQVSSNDFTQSGEAYWIYTQGASDYLSPLRPPSRIG